MENIEQLRLMTPVLLQFVHFCIHHTLTIISTVYIAHDLSHLFQTRPEWRINILFNTYTDVGVINEVNFNGFIHKVQLVLSTYEYQFNYLL